MGNMNKLLPSVAHVKPMLKGLCKGLFGLRRNVVVFLLHYHLRGCFAALLRDINTAGLIFEALGTAAFDSPDIRTCHHLADCDALIRDRVQHLQHETFDSWWFQGAEQWTALWSTIRRVLDQAVGVIGKPVIPSFLESSVVLILWFGSLPWASAAGHRQEYNGARPNIERTRIIIAY